MWGALELRLSSVTMNWRWGWSWRSLVMKRLAALRSQSFFAVPSCFIIGSGISGITARSPDG